jgi:hypothetical protein
MVLCAVTIDNNGPAPSPLTMTAMVLRRHRWQWSCIVDNGPALCCQQWSSVTLLHCLTQSSLERSILRCSFLHNGSLCRSPQHLQLIVDYILLIVDHQCTFDGLSVLFCLDHNGPFCLLSAMVLCRWTPLPTTAVVVVVVLTNWLSHAGIMCRILKIVGLNRQDIVDFWRFT